jgi:ABC-type nitrate/sulfonate/bicarbonate transport system ATPase subunit
MQVRQYSGGMKRRLSVAVSFVGDPLVVFLDEPSTGLDPASRRSLWDVVRSNKAGRGVLLTTHSMEEAQVIFHVYTDRCFSVRLWIISLVGERVAVYLMSQGGSTGDSRRMLAVCLD